MSFPCLSAHRADAEPRCLHDNADIWEFVSGPSPEMLFHPSPTSLLFAQKAAARLERRLAANEEADGFESKAKECIQAVAALKLLDWEAIRTERFSLTPPGLFSELVRNAEVLLRKKR